MLPAFSRIVKRKYQYTFFCLCLAVILFARDSYGQGLGDPIVKITFGSGRSQFAGPLQADSGFTDYSYVNGSPEDNEYTIANSTIGMNQGWVTTLDHTGNPQGYMMVVNAAYEPGLFYTRLVSGLCGSTKYEFSAWIKNILRPTYVNGKLPNITFVIEDVNGNYLGGGETNDIVAENRWREFYYVFETPANTESVVIKMVNNAEGGGGNDLAIDDITFRPYGQKFAVTFDQNRNYFCEGTTQILTMRSATAPPPGFAFKFQRFTANGWEDMRPAGTQTSIDIQTPTAPGRYLYRMVAADAGKINSPGCVIPSNELMISVIALPTAIMQIPDEICNGSTIFNENSVAPGSYVAGWIWDFGDGQTSTEQKPTHEYAAPGTYTVKLTVFNDSECYSATVSKNIRVITPVATDFRYSTPNCETRAITFTDISISTEGSITSRVWDFDDGSPSVQRSNNAPFDHTFIRPDTYNVKLTITTDKGCISVKTYAIIVSPLPVADFELPKVCNADPYAQFIDKSTIADNNTNFTYLWNFGDANATALNPNTSTQKNPRHYYGRTGKFAVTLTVTSANGCQFSKTDTLLVNGYPIPDFDVLNNGALCASKPVLLRNKARASFGSITKIEWYFNYQNGQTTPDTIDNDPMPDQFYAHQFPPVTYPKTFENYVVRMVAHTGNANDCQEIKEITIRIYANPVIAFTPPETVCLSSGPVPLTFTESAGMPGTPVFSGRGVTGAVFDPDAAGVGTWPITLVYTAAQAGSCTDTIMRNITVKPIPTMVDAGPNVSIVAGSSARINATARGNALRYRWTPSTGLSSDTVLNPTVRLRDSSVTYKLTVTMADGLPGLPCGITDSVRVTVLQLPEIPNAFTPNGDGINDTWEIKNLQGYQNAMINIFNRNGQRVYSSIGYNIPWDGRMNGANLPAGVYYYIVDPKNGLKQVAGYVTIIR